jgi:D-cysteine desulfhydrase
LCDKYDITNVDTEIIVIDDYLCGGYEKFNEQIKNISDTSLEKYGFILDRTYSGKAFYGMQAYIDAHSIKENILFWHTGGIFNFLA